MSQKPKLDASPFSPPTKEQIKGREALKTILKILDKQGDLVMLPFNRLSDITYIPLSDSLVGELVKEIDDEKIKNQK